MVKTRLLCLVLAAACSSAPVTPEQRRLAEARLLEPFLTGAEVGCVELQIEATGNFHGNVGQPAVDATFHSVSRSQGDGYRETVWTNKVGDPSHSFVVTIGEPSAITERGTVQKPRTTFTVVNQIRLRIWEDRRELQLDATASGLVMWKERGGIPREVGEFAIADGVRRAP
jgi:hypothetical protein